MIGPVNGSNQLPVNRIPVRHAVDYLRQHYAVEKGVDSMGYFRLGGSLQSAGEAERASCAQIHKSARDRARAEIGGCLSGAKISAWKETSNGDLVPCGGQWALQQIENETPDADRLYFATTDWNQLVPHLTSEISQEYFADANAGNDKLSLWLALELRRARAEFDKSRKDQDADFEAKGMPKCGPRVKATLKSASEICVALADATIAKASEFESTQRQLSEAATGVLAFTREIANSAIPLAFFVSGETGLGGSVVKAATDRGAQLYRDIEGAFALAKAVVPGLGKQTSPVASIFAIWRDEAINEFEVERDNVNSTFSKANRTQSAYHINGLVEGAEKAIKALIVKARELPLPDDEWSNLERHAVSVLAELTDQIREIAIGANGRAPQPQNSGETDRLMQPAGKRIAQEFEKLRLSKQFSEQSSNTAGTGLPAVSITAAPEPPKYQVIGTGDFVQPSTSTSPNMAIERFSDAERHEWIRAQRMMSADAAHKLFKVEPRFDGTKQAAFRKDWSAIKNTTRGRQRAKS